MKSKPLKRLAPVLAPEQEAFLFAKAAGKHFTLDAVLARHACAVPLRSMHDTLDAVASTPR